MAGHRRRRRLVQSQRLRAMTALVTGNPRSDAATVEMPSGKGRGDGNFRVGSWLIRRDLRSHVHAFYRFARNADDIADNPTLAAEDKLRRLDRMAAILDGAQGTEAGDESPAALAMRDSLAATGVTAQHCHDVLHAFRQDATKLRYRDWDDLMEYCRYSAAPVGRPLLDLHRDWCAACAGAIRWPAASRSPSATSPPPSSPAFSPAAGDDRDGLGWRRDRSRRCGAARDHSPEGRIRRHLVLLGDALATAGAPRRHVCALRLLPRGRRRRRRSRPARGEKASARRMARGNRRALRRSPQPPHPSGVPPRCHRLWPPPPRLPRPHL